MRNVGRNKVKKLVVAFSFLLSNVGGTLLLSDQAVKAYGASGCNIGVSRVGASGDVNGFGKVVPKRNLYIEESYPNGKNIYQVECNLGERQLSDIEWYFNGEKGYLVGWLYKYNGDKNEGYLVAAPVEMVLGPAAKGEQCFNRKYSLLALPKFSMYKVLIRQDEDGVYQITCANDLRNFAKLINENRISNKSNARLIADIDLNPGMVVRSDGTIENALGQSGPAAERFLNKWNPIGMLLNMYTGEFDGEDHTIRGVYVDSSKAFVGLFGCVNSGSIKNVHIKNSCIKGKNAAGIIGYCVYCDEVKNVSYDGVVVGENVAAGLVAKAINLTLEDSEHSGLVKAGKIGGGAVGEITYSNGQYGDECDASVFIENVKSSGPVRAEKGVAGGIVGVVFRYDERDASDNVHGANVDLKKVVSDGDLTGKTAGGLVGVISCKYFDEEGYASNGCVDISESISKANVIGEVVSDLVGKVDGEEVDGEYFGGYLEVKDTKFEGKLNGQDLVKQYESDSVEE